MIGCAGFRHLDGLFHRWPSVRMGQPGRAAALSRSVDDREGSLRPDDVLSVRRAVAGIAGSLLRPRPGSKPGVVESLWSPVEAAVRPQVLRTCGQYFGRMDLDPDQAGRHVAPLADAGGTRLHRRRRRDPRRRSGSGDQGN